jgi:hypothetical protein
MIAMGVCFVLLMVIAQGAFLLVAGQTADAAVDAAARAAARLGASAADQEADLLAQLVTAVPGAVDPEVSVTIDSATATARASFRWRPPGPDMIAVELTVVGSAPLASPP